MAQESKINKNRINKTIKKIAILIAKLSVSSILLYLLILKIGTQTIINNMRALSPATFIAAVGIYITTTYLSSRRWNLLIPQDMETKGLFSLYMIGSFFNAYMPGIIGGDAVKAYYLSKVLKEDNSTPHTHQSSLSVAIASVFMDRYIGFSALLAISIIAFPFGFKYLEGTAVKWLMPLVLVAFISGSIIVLKFRFGERVKFLFRIYEYFQIYSRKRHILFKAFLYSLVIQISGIVAIYILSKGISLNISFLSLLIFVPIIILISFIPVSISGIGLREGAFVIFLGTIGVPSDSAMTLSILWFLSVVVASLWGLFEYLRFKSVFGGEVK
ncbi:lysylphosphatidylglycerol synthase transmembrane domain-containing protein [Dissulfurispira sp.]|uniref:lysylphosphatidylglycerol synthase transmembrane domain-containing protein n=1 Tax=Dissulfurispira sp. TaxID=2817609 RepID=UPI002FD98CCD